jgi:hypothetical protein
MTDPDEHPPYRVEPEAARFKVVDEKSHVVVVTSSFANAGEYAALLNQAFRRGYKAGYRRARQAG